MIEPKNGRWAIGIIIILLLALVGYVATGSANNAAKGEAVDTALDIKIDKNTELIYINAGTVGRIEERLNSISTTQERILVILEK